MKNKLALATIAISAVVLLTIQSCKKEEPEKIIQVTIVT